MTKTAIALAAALVLGVASAARAENDSNAGNWTGYRVGPLGNSITEGVNPAVHRSLRRGMGAYNYDRATRAYGFAGGNGTTYCEQRFKSFDPISGTYLGFDGMRHPCP